MDLQLNPELESSARRMFPNLSIEQAFRKLLLERALKNLIRYQTIAKQFEARYGEDFDTFRQQMINSEPSGEKEQNYFSRQVQKIIDPEFLENVFFETPPTS